VPGHQRAESTDRAALGDGPFDAAYADGLAMSIDQAIELCRAPDLPQPAANGNGQSVQRLSRRTREIAALVARGLTNRQIAETLVLQESTVANHLRTIYNRLDLSGRAQLAVWASEHGLTGDVTA
jgi:non-specific serine/threonine protein kinase